MNKLTTHAKDRYFERADQEVSRRKIIAHIDNGGSIIFAKRLTASRSLAYIPIDDTVFKVIINRKTKVIISILPFNDAFNCRFKVHSEYYDNKVYLVEIYPDCYNETQSIFTLTKIYEMDENDNIITEVTYNHPFFEGLYKAVWKIYQGMKGLTNYETITAKNQKDTIEFKTGCYQTS